MSMKQSTPSVRDVMIDSRNWGTPGRSRRTQNDGCWRHDSPDAPSRPHELRCFVGDLNDVVAAPFLLSRHRSWETRSQNHLTDGSESAKFHPCDYFRRASAHLVAAAPPMFLVAPVGSLRRSGLRRDLSYHDVPPSVV